MKPKNGLFNNFFQSLQAEWAHNHGKTDSIIFIYITFFALLLTACGGKILPASQATFTPKATLTLQPILTVTTMSPSTSTPPPTATLYPDQNVLDGLGLELLLDTYQGLFLYDIDRTKMIPITSQIPSQYPLVWEWSSDGQSLLYLTQNSPDSLTRYSLHLYNPRTKKDHILLTTNFSGFHWHPNNQAILIGNTFIDASDGAILSEFQNDEFETAEWSPRAAISPDGRRLAITSPYFTSLYMAEIQLNPDAQVSGLSPFVDLNVSLDGRGIMDMKWNPQSSQIALELIDWNTHEGDVFLLNPDGGSLQNLTANMRTVKGRSMIASPLAWSSDGTHIAFTLYEQAGKGVFTNPRVFTVNVQSQTALEITGDEYPNGRDAFWTPDMQSLVFIDFATNRLIACRPDGSDKRIVVDDINVYYSDFRP